MTAEWWALGVSVASAVVAGVAVVWARRSANAAERANLNTEAQNKAIFVTRATNVNPPMASFEFENIGKGLAQNVTIQPSFEGRWMGGDRSWDLIRPDDKVPFGLMMESDTWNQMFSPLESRAITLSWTGQNGLPANQPLTLPFVHRPRLP